MGERRRTFYFDKTVEVEIDIEDLEEAGYHHEDDCPARRDVTAHQDLAGMLASLHRQAHPGAHSEVFMCREEPCRSLDMDLLGFGRLPQMPPSKEVRAHA
jgi:hypothetical protein